MHCERPGVSIMDTLNIQGITAEMEVCPECVKAAGLVSVLLTQDEVEELAMFLFMSNDIWPKRVSTAYDRIRAQALEGARA